MGINERLWYQKKSRTMNIMLRTAIMDVLPFDVDKEKADAILNTIFDTIVKGVKRDGFVTINGLGRFYLKHVTAKRVPDVVKRNSKKQVIEIVTWRVIPAHDKLQFKFCTSLYKKVKRF